MGPTNLHITTLHWSLILLGGLTTAPPYFAHCCYQNILPSLLERFFGLNCLLMEPFCFSIFCLDAHYSIRPTFAVVYEEWWKCSSELICCIVLKFANGFS